MRTNTRDMTMQHHEFLLERQREVLLFLKSRFPMYHLSNFFFRDLQFGVQAYLTAAGKRVSYREAEELANALARRLEEDKTFLPIDRQTWVVFYPEFRTPAANTAAPSAPVHRPAGEPAPANKPEHA